MANLPSPNDPPESAIPLASLDSILCTEELCRRTGRPPDYEHENGALVALSNALLHSPSRFFANRFWRNLLSTPIRLGLSQGSHRSSP